VLRRPLEPAQYTSLAFTEALREAGITGSIGTVGDSLDNALMESTIGLFKTEVIDHEQPVWRHWREVQNATASSETSHRPSTNSSTTIQLGPLV
jgi:transposase InsO family protein